MPPKPGRAEENVSQQRRPRLARAALRAERAKSGKRNAQKARKFIFNFNCDDNN
jgi:hypothetical protein